MLQKLTEAITTAARLADEVVVNCTHGEAVDGAVSHLADRVGQIERLVADRGRLPAFVTAALRDLTRQIAATTAAVEARRSALAFELETLVRRDRVRRAYTVPTG